MTPRECEILTLFASGYPRYADVATHLGISEHTVKAHMRNAYIELRARNREHAIAEAMRKGHIE